MKRISALLVTLALALTACAPLGGDDNPPSSRIEDSACGFNFEPAAVDPLPTSYHGITPTHAVRAQAYVCVERQWLPIGGLASVHIDAITLDPRVTGGVVKGGAGAPWPYTNIAARLLFNFPIVVAPGIQVVVSAGFDSILDANEMLTCWLVTSDGLTIPGSQFYTVQTQRGRITSVDCGAPLGETA